MGIDEQRRNGDEDDLAARQFRAFAAQLLRARAGAVSLSEADGRAGAIALSHELCQLIELQRMEAGRFAGGGMLDTHVQARYLKAALADELMLHTDWAGRAHWHHVLVEATLAKSAHAGEQVFNEIDALLRERDPGRRPLARLYLLLLACGFQGRYRGGDSLDPIADYRRELFQFASQRAPGQGADDAVLSGQPYASTLVLDAGRRLPRPRRRRAMLACTLLALLGVSEALWQWQSWPLRQALENSLEVGDDGRGAA